MKYLIVSDIHGSLPALEQVLAFYREQQCGMLCILGDILNYGPRNGIPQGLDPKGIAERLNAMAGEIVAIIPRKQYRRTLLPVLSMLIMERVMANATGV